MFNVTVLKMRDIVKYLVGIMIIIGLIVFATRFFAFKPQNKTETKTVKSSKLIQIGSLKSSLRKTLPAFSIMNENTGNNETTKKENRSNSNYLEEFLKTEISSIKGIEEGEKNNSKEINVSTSDENTDNSNNNTENDSNENNQNESGQLVLASDNKEKTEIVTPNPITESYNVKYGNVKIKNQTTYNLTEDILKPDIKIDNKNIVIFHTHSCESYTPSEQYQYTQTGNYRTTDLNYTVTRVGTELENYLTKYNINVVHDKSYHDYPSYTGSYTRSLQTVENILKTTQSDIIIDLHRDAIGSRPDYAPTVKIGDDYAAQIMFVIGTNEGGLWHPNWQQNLKFAVKIQEKAEEMYPGLFKPIMLTKSRYNQHTGKFANIIEVGATGNTLEQCLTSMKYLSAVMNEILK